MKEIIILKSQYFFLEIKVLYQPEMKKIKIKKMQPHLKDCVGQQSNFIVLVGRA